MNSADILERLEEIASTGNREDKETLLLEIVSTDLGKKVIDLAYNSFITFGVIPKKAKKFGTANFTYGDEGIWKLFDMLASRELTGSAAKLAVDALMEEHNEASAELLWRIFQKDLRCGVTAKTVNKVMPGTIPTFDVMLAHKFDEKTSKKLNWPVAVEPKLDGVRVICLVKDGKAQFFSRTGKPFPAVEHLGVPVVNMVRRYFQNKMPQHVANARVAFDGEIVSGNFNKTVGDVRRKDEAATDAEYHIFDVMPYTSFTEDQVKELPGPYLKRRDLLGGFMGYNNSPLLKQTPIVMAANADECLLHYAEFRAQGFEGAMVKPLEGIYEKRRSRNWLKLKAEETEDLVVIGAFEGNGKYAGMLGGLICNRFGVSVNVGGGLSDAQRVEFWAAYQKDLNTKIIPGEFTFEILNRMIEVEFHEVTPDGSLRHPRFIRFRDDKHDPMKEAA